ncbi:hypothetical protein BD626DRAFT_501809, partial [Schizophyllum amplum]
MGLHSRIGGSGTAHSHIVPSNLSRLGPPAMTGLRLPPFIGELAVLAGRRPSVLVETLLEGMRVFCYWRWS